MTPRNTDPRLWVADADWRDESACRGQDTDLWYDNDRNVQAAALLVCAVCPVAKDCLIDALTFEKKSTAYGIRGGVTEERRRGWLRQRQRPLPKPRLRESA